jgi:hypothetical protein
MGGNSMDGGSMGSNAPQTGGPAPKGMPEKRSESARWQPMLADSVDFEAIEKFRTAKEAYEKSLRKILTRNNSANTKPSTKPYNSSLTSSKDNIQISSKNHTINNRKPSSSSESSAENMRDVCSGVAPYTEKAKTCRVRGLEGSPCTEKTI